MGGTGRPYAGIPFRCRHVCQDWPCSHSATGRQDHGSANGRDPDHQKRLMNVDPKPKDRGKGERKDSACFFKLLSSFPTEKQCRGSTRRRLSDESMAGYERSG
ncbi:unnamed protein product [Coccothraustes coccothraustes]